jgi:hypothetical protein
MTDNTLALAKSNREELKKYFVREIREYLERKIGKLKELKTQHKDLNSTLRLPDPSDLDERSRLISIAENVLKKIS